jgi:uncharacterized protein YjiS (DUF1127 family)
MVLVLRGGRGKRSTIMELAASRLLSLFSAWLQRAAERRYLAALSDRDLNDLGLTRSDVAPDAPPRFWIR